MDLTVLNLALPAISADLQPSAAQLLWIIDIYGFMVAGFLITMGTLGDRIGRRKLLLIGAAAFAAASLVAAFSTSPQMLIAMRALLGLAGATVAPSTIRARVGWSTSTIHASYPNRCRRRNSRAGIRRRPQSRRYSRQ